VTKRISKAEASLLGVLLIVGAIVLAAEKIFEAAVYIVPLISFAVIIGAFAWHGRNKRRKRLEYLRSKYLDETIVQRIVHRGYWEGQTSEQLTDSLGAPVGVDKKITKTRTREVWKNNRRGANRYGLRITVDDGIVSGWDQKSW
jgi:hypothetical protein